MGRTWLFGIQGSITLILGGLLALITLFTSYSHVHPPFLSTVAFNQQIGVLLLAAHGRRVLIGALDVVPTGILCPSDAGDR